MKRISKEELKAFRDSGLFDEKYYLEQYPDVKMLGIDALEHYLWVGKKLGRRTSAPRHDRIQKSDEKNVTICDAVGSGLPDLFSLRAREKRANRCVVAFASDYEQLNILRSTISSMKENSTS